MNKITILAAFSLSIAANPGTQRLVSKYQAQQLAKFQKAGCGLCGKHVSFFEDRVVWLSKLTGVHHAHQTCYETIRPAFEDAHEVVSAVVQDPIKINTVIEHAVAAVEKDIAPLTALEYVREHGKEVLGKVFDIRGKQALSAHLTKSRADA